MNESLTPETTIRMNEVEEAFGARFEFRKGWAWVVSVHLLTDDDYTEPVVDDAIIEAQFVPEGNNGPAAKSIVEGEGHIGHHTTHSPCWMARLKFDKQQVSSPFGWPAPTLQACAEFILHEVDEGHLPGCRTDSTSKPN